MTERMSDTEPLLRQIVELGSVVTVQYVPVDSEYEVTEIIRIEGAHDTSSLDSVASNSSLGQAILGLEVGEEGIVYGLDGDAMTVKIIAIT